MVMVSFNLDDDLDKEIEAITGNKSEFIRDAISIKLGKKEKSLQELAVELQEQIEKFHKLDQQYYDKLKQLLEHKDQLKLQEIQDIEDKIKQKELKDKEFYEKTSSMIEHIDYIKNFDYSMPDCFNVLNLTPIVDKLISIGIRIGIIQLRSYLILRQKFMK
jgi:Arc/MetJ-type ribon-helix-helix transcriptional regulator